MIGLYKGVNSAELEPTEFSIGQNYSNPFKGKTTIKYCVAYKTRVQITVFDSEGKVINKLVDEEKLPVTYEVEFNIVETHGDASLQNDVYIYRLEAGNYKSEKKMTLIK